MSKRRTSPNASNLQPGTDARTRTASVPTTSLPQSWYDTRQTQLCDDSVTGKDHRGSVVCKIELAAGKAPEWVMLFPAPDAQSEIKCRDGRVFRMTSQADIVREFNASSHPIAFDKDHGVERVGWGGGDGAAIGWIEELQEKDGAIMCRVEWTAEGKELVESKKYRYVSPAFNITTELVNSIEKYRITMPTSAGLTNRPAMVMPALTDTRKANTMNEALLKLLGLTKEATQEQIDEATKKLEEKINAEQKQAEETRTKLLAELAAAKASAAQPALTNFVPRADFDAVQASLASVQKQLADDKAAAHKQAVDTEIASALAAGKIVPASADYHRGNCATPEGLANFRAFCASSPVIAPPSLIPQGTPPPGGEQISALDLEIAEKCGVSKEALVKYATHG